jgi:hypothetical protein
MLRLLSRGPIVAILAVSGCSLFQHHGPEYKPVSDADFGRLAPGQMAPVDTARGQLFAARDADSRAKLRLEEARHEAELGQAEQTAARADIERAHAEQQAAAVSNDPTVKARAQETAAQAELHRRAAQAHAAYAQKLLAAREAEVDAAQEMIKVREAELERAKLTALSQAGIPAATKYDPVSFDAHVAEAQRDYQQSRAKATAALHEADQTHNAWVALNQQYEARLQSARAAAGSGTGTAAGAAQGAPLTPATAPPQPGEAARAPATPPPAPAGSAPALPASEGAAAGTSGE